MAKKDNRRGDTPIEFRIPPASLGGKGPRVPFPINQPNWKYKFIANFKSNRTSRTIAGFFLLLAIVVSFLLIESRLYTSPLWLAVIVIGIIAVIGFTSEETIENESHPKRKDKKRSK